MLKNNGAIQITHAGTTNGEGNVGVCEERNMNLDESRQARSLGGAERGCHGDDSPRALKETVDRYIEKEKEKQEEKEKERREAT